MAIDATDWTISASGDIRYVGDGHGGASPTYATVIEFHRWLQDLADDASLADTSDVLDITDSTPSDRSTDNIITLNSPYNIDDTAAEHLYDGSITQLGGGTVYSGLVVVGSVETATELQIVQDGALLTSYWGTGLNADPNANILLRIMVKTRFNGADIDGKRLRVQARELSDTYAEFSLTAGLGNATAAIFTSNDLNNQTAAGTISGWTINNTEGYQLLDIAGDGSANEPFYHEWDHVTAAGGSNKANDIYEYTKWIQRRGTAQTIHGINGELFRGITHQIAYDTIVNGGPVENSYLAWGTTFTYNNEQAAGLTPGEYYVFGTSGAKGKLLALDDDGTTGFAVFQIESGTGPVVNTETFTRADGTANDGADVSSVPTVGGGGWGLALADNTTDTVWIQLISGTTPSDGQILYTTSAAGVHDTATDGTCAVNITVSAFTVSAAFVGTSTGSAIIGSRGVGFSAPGDTTANDQFFDLDNTLITPPNNQTFTVAGLANGEDRVLVGPRTGSALNTSQFTLNGALLGGEATITMNEAIPADTPATGTIRVFDGTTFIRVTYTGYTTNDFTGCSNTPAASNGANAFISYIDDLAGAPEELSFTAEYQSDRLLFVRVRDGGVTPIKTFETSATFGSGGGSVTAIRTSDA